MRAKEFLMESEGGMIRRAEEANRGKRVAFKNQAGNVITIVDAKVFPQDKDLEDDAAQITQEILSFTSANNIPNTNVLTLPPTSGLTTPDKAGAALVMIFKDESTGKNLAWIALKNSKKPGAYPIFLQTKLFSDLTGYVQLSGKAGEENKISTVQQRALTNLKPVGILPTNAEIAADDVASQVEKTIAQREDLTPQIKQQVIALLAGVSAGSTNPVPGAGDYAKIYEIDLGETAAPIALVKQKFLSGQWAEAEEGMGIKFSQVRGIEFPNDPAEKLYDSYLIIDDKTKIRISSKDKSGGAKASVSGVVDDITKYPERYEGLFDPKINPGFDELLEIVRTIKDPDMSIVNDSKRWSKNGSIAGTLQLGVKLGIINSKQSLRLLEIIDSEAARLSDKELGDLKSILRYKGTDDVSRPDYRIGWHLLAAVAAAVADTVNKKYKTDSFFKKILERSNMLQIKTSVKQAAVKDATGKMSNGAYFSNFQVIYPPVFTGTIKLDAGSNFYATRKPVGKMGFVIK
jgi:hypothetical protein